MGVPFEKQTIFHIIQPDAKVVAFSDLRSVSLMCL